MKDLSLYTHSRLVSILQTVRDFSNSAVENATRTLDECIAESPNYEWTECDKNKVLCKFLISQIEMIQGVANG